MNLENTILETLDIKIVDLNPERVVLSMPVGPKTRQPMGLLHGGASVVLAESAASIGAYLNVDPETQTAFGIEINANHLSSKKSGIVKAIATPIHRGKSTMVWQIEIVDEHDKKICISRCTIGIITKK
ncbi:hotdog fold thioesterase [Desulfitibacter alkalitolerans]|jgi:uncharacterized protein (TIGR00369 family)|uniref:hotdog fold thioesterase n=1 Tax=Desulfitibacter alkalitolerans TaxID=264641 RepID=UPI00047F8F27|nr:hotdog fold thioesterase [Desulfitibacter alkalitolerans]